MIFVEETLAFVDEGLLAVLQFCIFVIMALAVLCLGGHKHGVCVWGRD